MSKRVLIVEDEEAVRGLERFMLESQGYEVVEARDGLEGLTKAEFGKPDLILLDLMMPDRSDDARCVGDQDVRRDEAALGNGWDSYPCRHRKIRCTRDLR
jgi:CheY-like chemotaxis protein